MSKDSLLSIRIPQGCQDWRGVESVPWVLQLLDAGLTKKAVADHFGKTVMGIDKAIARYHDKKKTPADTGASTRTSPDSSNGTLPQDSSSGEGPDASAGGIE